MIKRKILHDQPTKKTKLDQSSSKPGFVDSLMCEVTESEKTCEGLPEKMSSVLDSILASGLNVQALAKRKVNISRPDNCQLLREWTRKSGTSLGKTTRQLSWALMLHPLGGVLRLMGSPQGDDGYHQNRLIGASPGASPLVRSSSAALSVLVRPGSSYSPFFPVVF